MLPRTNTLEERKAKAALLADHGWLWSPALGCYLSPKATLESQPVIFPTDILNETLDGLQEYIEATDGDVAHVQQAVNGFLTKVRNTHSDNQGIRQ